MIFIIHNNKSNLKLLFTKNVLVKKITIKIIFRSYPGRGHAHKILNLVSKNASLKPPSSNIDMQLPIMPLSEAKEQTSNSVINKVFPSKLFQQKTTDYYVIHNKESILKVLEYFERGSLEDFSQKEHLILFIKYNGKYHADKIFSRQGQVTQELLFAKHNFEHSVLRNHFTGFELEDLLGQNKGIADFTTLFNLNAGEFLVNNVSAMNKVDLRVIISTYRSPLKIRDLLLSDTTKSFLNEAREKTGNKIPDASLNGIPYDFKPDPALNKNFISFALFENFVTTNQVYRYHMNLKAYLSALNTKTAFQENYLKILIDVLNEPSLNSYNRQQILNDFILTKLSQMSTLQDRASLIIPLTHSFFVPNSSLEKNVHAMELPLNKTSVNESATKKAILVEMSTWTDTKQNIFHYATKDLWKYVIKDDNDNNF